MLYNKEQELLRKAVRDFVSKELDTLPAEMDKTGVMPKELIKKLADAKFISRNIPEEYGGNEAREEPAVTKVAVEAHLLAISSITIA